MRACAWVFALALALPGCERGAAPTSGPPAASPGAPVYAPVPSQNGPTYGPASGPAVVALPPPQRLPSAAVPSASAPPAVSQPAPAPRLVVGLGGGCSKPKGPTGVMPAQTINFAGQSRTFVMSVPPGYAPESQSYPLVIALHGDGGDGQSARSLPFEAAAQGGAIFAYPDGKGRTWDLNTAPDVNADFAFFDALVAAVTDRYCVSKVVVAGYSRGGYMANQLACFRAGTVRGVISMASGGPYDALGKAYNAQGNLVCGNGAPVAAMVVHGLADGEVSMSEGDKSLAHWRARGGCKGTSPKMLFDSCVEYTNCGAGSAVWHCAVPGLGHGVWPRSGEAGWAFIRSL